MFGLRGMLTSNVRLGREMWGELKTRAGKQLCCFWSIRSSCFICRESEQTRRRPCAPPVVCLRLTHADTHALIGNRYKGRSSSFRLELLVILLFCLSRDNSKWEIILYPGIYKILYRVYRRLYFIFVSFPDGRIETKIETLFLLKFLFPPWTLLFLRTYSRLASRFLPFRFILSSYRFASQ